MRLMSKNEFDVSDPTPKLASLNLYVKEHSIRKVVSIWVGFSFGQKEKPSGAAGRLKEGSDL